MGDWKDRYKGAGPFPFIPQYDKPHYNEGESISDPGCTNPVWKSPELWATTKITPEHEPWCGYWYKDYTPYVPPVLSGAKILLMPQYPNGDDEDNGIAVAIYDTATSTWSYGGSFLGDGYPALGQPHTARINSDFVCYYGDWATVAWDYSMRCNVFRNGSHESASDLWVYSSGVMDFNPSDCQNMMDCNEDGLIACLAYIVKDGGVSKKAWAITCSTNRAVSWGTPYYFPSVQSGTSLSANVRLDASGNIWVAFLSSQFRGLGDNSFSVYKSTDNGANFSLIHKEALSTDVPLTIFYTIDSTGQYQYLAMRYLAGGSTGTSILYVSSDSGANWSGVPMTDLDDSLKHASNVANVTHPYYPGTNTFKVSSNSGASFAQITPPIGISDSFVDIQNDFEWIAYTECGEDFDTGTLGALYSDDNGATWNIINIPSTGDFAQEVFTAGWQQSVDVYEVT